VTPISLGIFASANTTVEAGDFQSIATTTVGSGGAASVTFSSIPATFTHLQIRFIARTTSSNNIQVYFNTDSSNTNYAFHNVRGDGATASVLAFASGVGNALLLVNEGSSTTANTFGAGVVDILDYANTNKNTTARSLGGNDNNGSGVVGLNSKLWLNTAAVNSIELLSSGNNFQQYSHFALYGIKGVA
jgi:hypothetical protein